MAKRSAGTLDRKITIQRSTETVNEFNEPQLVWADFYAPRAARRDVSDGERFAAGQVGSHLMTRFVIRASSETETVTPVDRISYDGAIWNIHGIKEADQGDMRGRFLEITAVRNTD
jgi:SPP1 family predicted phage head-tail adaptor